MKKNPLIRIITLLIVLACMCFLPTRTQAADASSLVFTLNADGVSYSVTGNRGFPGGVLEIPATYNGKPVTSIGYNALSKVTSLTGVIIPNSVDYIGRYAFKGCKNLVNVTLPDSLTEIADYAFSECTTLSSITIPQNVTSIWGYAFSGCTNLTTVNFNAVNCETMGSAFYPVFSNCTNLNTVNIGSGVTKIPDYAFSGCAGLTGITISDSVTEIGCYAFYGCTGLTNLNFSNSAAAIGCRAFYNCTALKSVTFSDNITSIGEYAFFGCANLKDIAFPSKLTSIGMNAFHNTAWYSSQPDGLVYAGSVVYKYKGTCPETVIIKDGTLGIGDAAFSNCTSLSNINIPDGVIYIGNNAFYCCFGLTFIDIPGSVLSIGHETCDCGVIIVGLNNSAFGACKGVEYVSVSPENERYYSENNCIIEKDTQKMIFGCKNSLIPSGVTEIAADAFRGQTDLYNINIPKSVKSISAFTFDGCSNLTDVYYEGSAEDYQIISVSDSKILKEVTLHYNGYCLSKIKHTFDDPCDAFCNVCEQSRTAPHTYEWVIDQENDCGTEGIKHEECTACHTKRNENTRIAATGNHSYDNACDALCNVCQAERTPAEHIYDDVCDTICNACGHERTAPHSYLWVVDIPNTCGTDGMQHEECTACHAKRNENTAIAATGLHNYVWIIDKPNTCGADGIQHEECSTCHHKQNENTPIAVAGEHTYTDNADALCDICNFKRFHILYDMNGGSEGPASCWIEEISMQIHGTIPQKDGHVFAGWYCANSTTALFQPGDTINTIDDVELFAIWAKECSKCNKTGETYVNCSVCDGRGSVPAKENCNCLDGQIRKCNNCGSKSCTYVALWGYYQCNSCKSLSVSVSICTVCDGTGEYDGSRFCSDCGGKGKIYSKCTECAGVGNFIAVNWVVDGNLTTSQVKKGTYPSYSGSTYKVGNEYYTYVFNGWNRNVVYAAEHIIYTATYTRNYTNYKIIFKDEDGTILSRNNYHYGDPVVAPPDPIKEADHVGIYTFNGWDKDVVTSCVGDATYTATYTTDYIDYTVVFKNWDGTVLSTNTYRWGDAITEPSAPTKAADNTYAYTFAGWDKAVVNCAGNVTYTATYTPIYKDYTVVFKDEDGTVLSTKTYHWGDKVTAPANPIKSADNTYTFAFVGWDKAVVNCAGNVTYTATYTSTYKEYTVVFKNWDGSEISSATYHWGDTVQEPEKPVRPNDDYAYSFAVWDKEITACDGDKVYIATYKSWQFADVSTSSWQIGPVVYACDRNLMAGKGTDENGNIKFDPNSPITREEFVQVLYNAENKPSISIANIFPDVKDAWYKNAVLWANEAGIASGMGNGNFGVGKNISRQDLAMMLYKYAKLKGCTLEAEEGKINQFADGNKVASYAKTAMDWAVTNRVLSGKGEVGKPLSTFKLDPAGTATRAECAAMLKNFMEAFGL